RRLTRIFGKGTLQGAGRPVVGGQQLFEARAQLLIALAFPFEEGGAGGRIEQVEGGDEQGFDAARVEGPIGSLRGRGAQIGATRGRGVSRNPEKYSVDVSRGAEVGVTRPRGTR